MALIQTGHLVANDRIINKFPQAFHPDATPYQKMNFDVKVKEACAQNKTGTVGLKVSKAVIVGDVAVGKSCLINRFCHNIFDRDYKATIGVDFEVEKFSLLAVPFNLQIWDTAGQERFRCIASSYYRGANVVIVVFDLNDIDSLAHTPQWKQDACSSANDPLVFLVGTKKDIVSQSAYSQMEEEAMKIANDMKAEFWSVSSRTGHNVKEFFFRLAALTFDEAIMKETESLKGPRQQIGSNLIKVDHPSHDLYEISKPKLKCCN